MPRPKYTDEELNKMDQEEAIRRSEQRRLLGYEDEINAAGLDLDHLIELIEARKEGRY